jgi:rhodanese-related sulfurtransferase
MTTTTTRQSHLIDVRSPVEFATGPLTSDIAPTINIEYTSIASLPSIYAARGINVRKDDDITLYCRSGRRSNIALNTLREMGYSNVRDIGGFEEARRVLDREQVGRQLDREMELMPDLKKELKGGAQEESEDGKKDGKKHVRVQSFNALLEGLKAEDS